MKLTKMIIGASALALLTGCGKDSSQSTWEDYTEWREDNIAWLEQQASLVDEVTGEPVYTKVVPAWNENAYVLMRWFNDRDATAGNLRPLFTSTVDVKYIGRLYNDVAFDSSYVSLSPADSVLRFEVGSTIPGWVIAMEQMHVGDTVEVLIPYEQAYGASQTSIIKPFSALRFNIRLVDVAGEYVKP